MLNWGKDMIQGLIDGIKNMIGKVGDAVKGVADKIKGFLHFSRPDEGPLREYEQWMPDMIRGLTSSLDKASPSLINKVKDLAQDMSDSLKIDGTVNAMSEFHQIPEDFDPSGGSSRSIGGGSTYIINVNQPVSTPDEMANAIRVESQYGLIEGVPI
jgi:phage-related protein